MTAQTETVLDGRLCSEKDVDYLRQAMDFAGIPSFGVCSLPSSTSFLPCRARQRIPKDAVRLIVCLFPYYVGEMPHNISRYAIVADYHLVVRDMLEKACRFLQERYPEAQFAWFTDSSPFPEVTAAVQAGLGVRGKNGLLITKAFGTYQFIGEIATDFPFTCNTPSQGGCIGCGKCIQACPSGCLSANGRTDAVCLSAVTQKKGELSQEEEALVRRGGLLWGCDICQEVCPHNHMLQKTSIRAFSEDCIPILRYEDIPALVKTRAFGFRGAGVLQRNYRIIYGEP
ncbi:MAG TPA: DUF1730 domain-containing protein [Firmicutes bacterium]|nr:DUF1730 domain-containing protein [Bacillota bacterium]